MAELILEVIYYLVYAVELFLIGDGIFHNRVRSKRKYAVMTGVYILVVVPTVLFFDHNIFMIRGEIPSAYITVSHNTMLITVKKNSIEASTQPTLTTL